MVFVCVALTSFHRILTNRDSHECVLGAMQILEHYYASCVKIKRMVHSKREKQYFNLQCRNLSNIILVQTKLLTIHIHAFENLKSHNDILRGNIGTLGNFIVGDSFDDGSGHFFSDLGACL